MAGQGQSFRWEFEEGLQKAITQMGEITRPLLKPELVAARFLEEVKKEIPQTERNINAIVQKVVTKIIQEAQWVEDASALEKFVKVMEGYFDGTHGPSVGFRPPTAANVTEVDAT